MGKLYRLMPKNEKGFTFVEVMITMVVVVLVLLGYMGANMNIQHASEAAYQRTVALQDANRVVELIRNVAATGQFPANVTTAYPGGAAVGGFTNLPGERVFVAYRNQAADPLDVTVTVSWLENGVRAVNTAIRTYVTQRV